MSNVVLFAGITRVGEFLTLGDHVVGTLPWGHVVDVHPVEFLESTATTFDDTEVDDKDTKEEATGEHVTVGKVDFFGDERGEETDQKVPQPVGCSGQRHTLGTVSRGEKLSSDSPDHRAPGHGIACHMTC